MAQVLLWIKWREEERGEERQGEEGPRARLDTREDNVLLLERPKRSESRRDLPCFILQSTGF